MTPGAPLFIDTHAHLDSDIYSGELDVVVKHAKEEGVRVIAVGSDFQSSAIAVNIAERFRGTVYAAVGIHPLKLRSNVASAEKLVDMEGFRKLASHPSVVAFGETGLDFHELPDVRRNDPDFPAVDRVKNAQKQALGAFLQLSRELRLPLLLHCREAHDEMLEMLEAWDKTSVGFDARGIIHCFSGDWKQARRYFNLDFMISATGVIAHANFQTEVIKKTPLTRLVLESDCPYLTPTHWSIRRNEPSYLPGVAAAVAGIRGEKIAEVAAQTTENSLKIFRKIIP